MSGTGRKGSLHKSETARDVRPRKALERLIDERGPTQVAKLLVAALENVKSPNGSKLAECLKTFLAATPWA